MEYVLLGIIQGFTEFLPVSSSGHLVIFQKFFQVPHNIAFDVAVHLATTFAVIIYFRKDIANILQGFFSGIAKIISKKEKASLLFEKDNYFKLSCLLAVSFIITAIIGLLFSDFFESLFSSPKAVGGFLLLTAALLFIAEKFPPKNRAEGSLNLWDSIVVGLFQSAAIAPGLSRSGSTISAGLMRGFSRELAAKYSFLLAVPTILAAGVFEARKIAEVASVWPLIAGAISAFISGYLAILFFMKIISRFSLRGFAYYCAIIGLAVLVLL
ncbi:MAG: undecaprenyl-diphosphatase [Candidatus Saganbacteria bacterium]|uniref:Undecaprenyl-diphosphatase n=1 Tax=Candidatus Saganbacteria bacterium TaxID=2575572 RepID=A0A833L039_UNCSA|nr:MAG: undecaprenyl-diphosphatase [Candidatus Saganbacteria bacterium]